MTNPVCGILGMLLGIYGVCSAPFMGSLFWLLLGMAGIVAAVCIVFRKRAPAVIALFTIAGSLMYGAAERYPMRELEPYMDRYVTLTGTVDEVPYEKDGLYYYMIRAHSLEYRNEQIEPRSVIKVSAESAFSFGDTVRIQGFLEAFRDKMNDSGFDSAAYYNVRGIYYRMYASQIDAAAEPIKVWSVRRFVTGIKNGLCAYVDQFFLPEDGQVLKTVITGNYKQLDYEVSNAMVKTGVRRYLYTPYIHMFVICLVLGLFQSGFSKKTQNLIMAVFMLIYSILNSTNPVFFRAFMFAGIAGVFSWATGARRNIDYWSLSTLICALANPLLLRDCGFIMSAASQFIFLNIRRPVYDRIYKILLKRGRKPGALGKRLLNMLVVTVIFWLGTSPLAAYYFNTCSLWVIFAGILYVPAVILLIGLLPLGAVLAKMGAAGAFPLRGINQLIFVTERLIAYLPQDEWIQRISYIRLMKPSLLFLAAYYTAGTGVWMRLKKKKSYYTALMTAAGIAVSGLGLYWIDRSDTEISFVNVDQGDAAYIRSRGGERILIDGGGGYEFSDFNFGEFELLPFLYDEGAHSLDHVIVSHYHKDHVWGLISVMKECRVWNLYLPDCMEDNTYRIQLEQEAQRQGTAVHYVSGPMQLILKKGQLNFLDMFGEAIDENDTSLVVKFEDGDFSMLFTRDIATEKENLLLERGQDVSADVLKVPHHGSAASSGEAFLNAVKPRAAVVGVGADNPYNHPARDTLERYENAGIHVLRTDEAGTIQIRGDENGIKGIRTYRWNDF